MMVLGIPVVDGHNLTDALLKSLADTVADPKNFTAVIIDNDSEIPYEWSAYRGLPFAVELLHNSSNFGYYRPLRELYRQYPEASEIGLVHNDMVLYSRGWDVDMSYAFESDPQLGLIGLCGSNEIDERGGRGGGTMCNFMGQTIDVGPHILKGQDPAAGRRIAGLQAACVLDSLFMMFRRDTVPALLGKEKWEDLPLAHFYDRIWPCRTIEAGYRVAVMGVDCDHIGGMTAVGNQRYRDDCIAWLLEHRVPFDNPETEMYLLAERRFLQEYREDKHFLPCRVDASYRMEHHYAR
jgi:hypothetical protein